MKRSIKIILVILLILIIGNSLYIFTWTRDMLKGFTLGIIITFISIGLSN